MTLPATDPETLRSHVAFVRSVARAALAGDAEVEDVVQETWLAALQGGPRDRRSLRAWLAAVTRRQAALLIRRRTRDRRRLAGLAEERGLRWTRPDSAAEALARAETGRRLVDAVLTLPEIYRSVLLLRYQDDLPPREVARRLDLPVETVRTRLRRGLIQLRERLEASDSDRGTDWRASLVLLLPGPPPGVSTTLGTLVGAALVKKSILAALTLALLLGGALLTWELVSSPAASVPGAEPSARPDGASHAATTSAEPSKVARLGGHGERRRPAGAVDADPVDLGSVDRARDLHGTLRDAVTGEPVGEAKVVLIERTWARAGTFDPERQREERVRATAQSASDGTWRIRLEPGDGGDLHVRAPAYAAHRVRAVQAGERVDLRLERGTSLRVQVMDAHGQVRAGTHVRIFQASQATRGGHGFSMREGVTDEDGLHVVTGLPPGVAVTIDVSHPVDGAAMSREARTAGQGTAEVEIALPRGRTLTGCITDARTGLPIAGARVGIGWMLDAAVTTDATGRYTLPGWTAQGVYEIAVRAEGYAQDEALVGARTSIDFALALDDRIRGRTVDGAGRPVAGVRVSAVGSSWETGRQVTSGGTAVSREDGRFEVHGLRHDMPHRLILVARGYGRTLHDVRPPPAAGGTRDLGDVRLAPAGAIAGRVRRADGTPVQRVAVLIAVGADRSALTDGAPTSDHDYGLEEERYTDDLGRFLFPDVAPGTYVVTTRLPGGSSVKREVVLPVDPLRVAVELTVNEGRSFTVVVEDTAGEPLDQAMVFVATTGDERLTGTTDASGRALFQLLAEPVSVRVDTVFELSRKRYIEPPEAEVPPDSDEIRVVLTPAGVIRGRVLDEQDRPLPRVTLRAVRDGVLVADSWTRRDGTFQLTVPVGAQVDVELAGTRLEEAGAGFVAREAFLEGGVEGARAGDEGVVVRARTVERTGTITIRVTDPGGRPLADAVVFVSRPDLPEGGGIATARTGADGETVLRELPVAELELAAARAPRARGEEWMIPRAVRATPRGQSLTLAYRPAARVAGIVVDADGEPSAGVRVEAAFEGGAYHATSDEGGRFSAMVPADAAEITVRLLHATASGARRPAVTARPGDTDLRLRLE